MTDGYVVYGAKGSGSVAVEAALTLIGLPYELVEEPALGDPQAAMRAAAVNPLRQVPALVLPPVDGQGGELMTESAAILTWLADAHPAASLAPPPASPLRPRFLRWMSFISAQIYSLYWIRDDISRLAADPAHEAVLRERTAARIVTCYAAMETQVEPAGAFILGETVSVLDIYLAVASRWGPRRKAFYAAAPRLAQAMRNTDAEPRLAGLWAERMPFIDGWEG